jgi:cell wall-associated NlpC family hydrolase
VPARINRETIQEQARKYLGIPWRHQGRNPDVGIDCAGLVVLIAKDLGLSNYDAVNYHRNPMNDAFIRHFADNMEKRRIVDRKMGDVVLFKDKMFSCHSGIVTFKNGQEHLLHAYAKRKQVIEEPFTEEWRKKISYCFRFHGVID